MLLSAMTLALAGGCVSQSERDNLQTLYRKSQEQVVDLKAQLEEARARMSAMQGTPHTTVTADPQLRAQLAAVTQQRDQLAGQIRALEARIRAAARAPIQLPPEIDAALRQLAEQHSEVMTYDPGAGMVKLRSDLTFALGSANVSEAARKTLGDLGAVLQGVVGQGYEIRVVGHTDNVPIRKPSTKVQHPTNWHLSVHRAIAVKDVLAGAGISNVRLGVAGHGEHRPMAANAARGGNEANRRVEIYIVPNTYNPTFTPTEAPIIEAPSVGASETPAVQPEPDNTPPAAFK